MSKKEKFYIAQIEDEKKKEYTPSKFASPYNGTNAKDDATYPYVKYGNEGRQYQSFKNENINVIYRHKSNAFVPFLFKILKRLDKSKKKVTICLTLCFGYN